MTFGAEQNQFEALIDRIGSVKDVRSLRRAAYVGLRKLGFCRIAYVHSVLGRPQNFYIDQIGFPAAFEDEYSFFDIRIDDPLPAVARRSAFPVRWSDVEEYTKLSRLQTHYLAKLRNLGIGDGISVNVTGPNGRNGYFALGYGRYNVRPSRLFLAKTQLICQAAHTIVCDFTLRCKKSGPSLSRREIQILGWVAEGKSNSVIADILGISKHTVDTLTKRLFVKLGVFDRVSAVVEGLRLGVLPHNALS
ncbi:MAG: LuxR C-terminal-related transcriptional regulator [Yoonia sp.]